MVSVWGLLYCTAFKQVVKTLQKVITAVLVETTCVVLFFLLLISVPYTSVHVGFRQFMDACMH